MKPTRHHWTRDEVEALFRTPLLDLVFQAATVHRAWHQASQVQVCKLISIKTGGCPEDCSYCSQSSRYETEIKASALMEKDEVVEIARKAKASGVSRVCLGAAWREVKNNRQFDRVLEIVRDVAELDLEVCCTLGMLTAEQAARLEEAGLYAYNHNLDTSPEHYSSIITTRTYADRLNTIKNVRTTNVTVCSGGIIGLGETETDRVGLLLQLASLDPHPESVPINVLAKVAGTPMAEQPDVPAWETVRMIAAARIMMPAAVVRLSAGRAMMSVSDQALCFLAGANSIFSSDTKQMLTRAVPSPDYDEDRELLNLLGLKAREPYTESLCQQSPLPSPV